MSMEKRMKALASMGKIFNEILVDHAGKTKKTAEEATEPEEKEPDAEKEEKKDKPEVKTPSWMDKKASYTKKE